MESVEAKIGNFMVTGRDGSTISILLGNCVYMQIFLGDANLASRIGLGDQIELKARIYPRAQSI